MTGSPHIRCALTTCLLVCFQVAANSAQPQAPPDESVLVRLRSDDVEVRRAAADRLVRSEPETKNRALPWCIEALENEKDGQVRLAVFDTLTDLGPDAASAVAAIAKTLRSEYGGKRREERHQDYRAALALAAIGKPAVDHLVGLLEAKSGAVRANAVMALGRIGPDAASAVQGLAKSLGDESAAVRAEAGPALWNIGDRAVPAIVVATGHDDPLVRIAAFEGLSSRQTDATDAMREAVLAGTQDENRKVRAAAIMAVRPLGLADTDVIEVVAENVTDESEDVQVAIVNLLVARRDLLERLLPELKKNLTHSDRRVARHAAFLLQCGGRASIGILLDAFRNPKCYEQQLARALAQIGTQATPELLRAIQDDDPRVRAGAALALGQIRPANRGSLNALVTALDDPEKDVQLASLKSLEQHKHGVRWAAPAVRKKLAHDSSEIRGLALEVLFGMARQDDQLVDDFVTVLDDDDVDVRLRAVQLLRALGPGGRKALPQVIEKLRSDHAPLRLAAVQMINSHGAAAAGAVSQLTELLNDDLPEIRASVARTLGECGVAAQPAYERLGACLDDDALDVRSAAALALTTLEIEPGVIRPYIVKALQDDQRDVRRAAMRGIRRLDDRGAIFIPDLIGLAQDEGNRRSVRWVLRQFERSGAKTQSISELIPLLDNGVPEVRSLAAKFLGLAGSDAAVAIPRLKQILTEDTDDDVKQQASVAIERIQEPSAVQSS